MHSHYVTKLFWASRRDEPAQLAYQLNLFLSAIRGIEPSLAGWVGSDRRGEAPEPVGSVDQCERALERNVIHWHTGPQERMAYGPRLRVGNAADPVASLALTCGIEPLDMGPVFVPNRLELAVRCDVGKDGLSRPVLERIAGAGASAFNPDFGFVGSYGFPVAPKALFSDGTPPVGWMTYLSRRYPPLPVHWPTPIVAHAVGKQGHLIVAHPKLFDERDQEQRRTIDQVRKALIDTQVLISASLLAAR